MECRKWAKVRAKRRHWKAMHRTRLWPDTPTRLLPKRSDTIRQGARRNWSFVPWERSFPSWYLAFSRNECEHGNGNVIWCHLSISPRLIQFTLIITKMFLRHAVFYILIPKFYIRNFSFLGRWLYRHGNSDQDQVFGCQDFRLIDWSIERIVVRWIDLSIDWLIDWWMEGSVDWLIGWLATHFSSRTRGVYGKSDRFTYTSSMVFIQCIINAIFAKCGQFFTERCID